MSGDDQSAWTLSPDDLPPEPILLAEPRLRGLENNALFRAAIRESKKRGAREAWAWTFGSAALIALLWGFASGHIQLSDSVWFGILMVAQIILPQLSWTSPGRSSRFLSPAIPYRVLAELAATACPPADAIAGLWGARLAPWRLQRRKLRLAAFAAACILLILSIPGNPFSIGVRILFYFVLARIVALWWATRYQPYDVLGHAEADFVRLLHPLRKFPRTAARMKDANERFVEANANWLGGERWLPIAVLIGLFSLPAAVFLLFGISKAGFRWSEIPATAWILAAGVVGAGFGEAMGRYAKSVAPTRLRHLQIQAAILLEAPEELAQIADKQAR